MSDHVPQSEENADFTPHAIPAPEDTASPASEQTVGPSEAGREAGGESSVSGGP